MEQPLAFRHRLVHLLLGLQEGLLLLARPLLHGGLVGLQVAAPRGLHAQHNLVGILGKGAVVRDKDHPVLGAQVAVYAVAMAVAVVHEDLHVLPILGGHGVRHLLHSGKLVLQGLSIVHLLLHAVVGLPLLGAESGFPLLLGDPLSLEPLSLRREALLQLHRILCQLGLQDVLRLLVGRVLPILRFQGVVDGVQLGVQGGLPARPFHHRLHIRLPAQWLLLHRRPIAVKDALRKGGDERPQEVTTCGLCSPHHGQQHQQRCPAALHHVESRNPS
mmetsp:Transcript_29282/g.82615  ORF Transcript_29282/g.82615 Transcript_29282/m.82615 type:complete len:274 (-) Transcript_29282:303-1124(-)